MIEIRYIKECDKEFWYTLDKHLPKNQFEKKVNEQQGYIIFKDNMPIGILRYNLFWDNIPFCTLLYIEKDYQGKGFGKNLLSHWEEDMKAKGYDIVLTSTQADEEAQHFYRKCGYTDCGALIINIPKYSQPTELFLIKEI